MNVILLKDVEKLGTEGAVVHVRPGYARNYLIPLGLAVSATAAQRHAVEALKRQRLQRQERLRAAAAALKQQLESRSVTFTLTLGADGTPFGSVTIHDIVEALAREGLTVQKAMVQLEQPLKVLGLHEVPVRLHPEVTAALKVLVTNA